MNRAKENLLLHPVRLRIIVATAGRGVTARQLGAELPDVPQASLYRNINALAAGGILSVVGERRVRNTIEKTYALASQNMLLTLEDLKKAQPEDYVRLFTQFLGQLLGYYVRYVQSGDVDFARDSVLFRMVPVYLSEAETRRLRQTLNADLLPVAQNKPSPQRRRSILGLMFLPDASGAPLPASTLADTAAVAATHARKQKEKKGKQNGRLG